MDWLLSVLAEIVAVVLATGAIGAVAWVVSAIRDLRREILDASSASDSRMDGFEARLVKVEELERQGALRRLGELERLASSLATSEQIGRIHSRIDDLKSDDGNLAADIGELKGLVRGQSKQLQIIQQHLIERRD